MTQINNKKYIELVSLAGYKELLKNKTENQEEINAIKHLICNAGDNGPLPLELPPALEVLDCFRNNLTFLPYLPSTLRELFCAENKLTSLPSLPPGLQKLECGHNQLTSLPQSLKFYLLKIIN
jgi:Leucine-rich repeat (LRR) protein